jgi:class 3 adenylate cyclase/tetratricopeptide (TPR) repeat protein
MICPGCGHDNPTTSKFCGECGARLANRCAACGSTNPPGHKFCGECGRPLTAAAPSSAPQSAPSFGAPQAYTPKHLAERILTSKAALEGERKHVTVLFADVKGSMELLADRDPEEARKIIDPVLAHMMEAVHRYEGTVNQVMGDGIMALFGAPLAHEDHAARACYAALRMQDLIRRYTEETRSNHGIEVHIRIGINSGEVVVRAIGSDLRMDYSAVGQTTHLAARLEQLAPPGATRLTAETVRLAEGFIQVKPLGAIPVKGVAEPREVFELAGAAAVRTRLQASRAHGLTRFVGRDAEFEQVRQAVELARRGRGQIVAIVGEPGVGKSRLLHEFIHSHHSHGWRVLEASSVSYGKATPFLPVSDLLRAYLRIEDRDDARGVRAKTIGTLLSLDRALEDVVPAIAWLLDALEPDDAFLMLEPAQRRQRAVEGIKRLFLRESRSAPLLLVFEDLHWIDAETQAVLDGLVASLPTAPILLAVNYRPEYRHEWGAKTYYRQLRIDPLPPESAGELLETLLGSDPALVPLKALLIERTEGNPLFLEESVRTLVESAALVGEAGAYRLAKAVAAIEVPPTVQAILATRIDRLAPALKRLLQAASVIGKDVPFALLEAIAEIGGDELRRALSELQTAEFLYEARLFPDLEYTFKHALTHDVAYGSLLEDRRRALHAAVVEAIERLHADRLNEEMEVLAHHAARASLGAKAVRYLRKAGEKAVARSANKEAADLFETALRLLAEMPETAESLSDMLDIHIALAPALIAVHGPAFEEVRTVYERALALVERLGDVSRRFPVLWGLWYVAFTSGRYQQAHASAEQLLSTAQGGNDISRLVEAHHSLWATLSAMGDSAGAVTHAERGITLYDPGRDASNRHLYAGHDAGACCRYHAAMNRWLLGYPDQAVTTIRDAYLLAQQLGHPLTIAHTLWFMAWIEYHRGERDTAAETAERLASLADTHGFKAWLDERIIMSDMRASVQLDALALAKAREQLLLTRRSVWAQVSSLCMFAERCLDAGHPEEGLRALANVGATDRNAFYAPEIYRIEGGLLLQIPQSPQDAAEQRLWTALDLARRRSEKSLELRAAMSLARLWHGRGKSDEARRLLGDVYGWFTEGLDTRDLRAAKTLLDELRAPG